MKNLTVLLVLILVLSAVTCFFVIKNKRTIEPCPNYPKVEFCKDERRPSHINKPPLESDLTLKLNCDDSVRYQIFQNDLINGFSILGRMKVDEEMSKITQIKFKILEGGSCKRYYIKDLKFLKKFNDVPGNWLKFTINNGECNLNQRGITYGDDPEEKPIDFEMYSRKAKGFAVVIDSDNDSRIITNLLWSDILDDFKKENNFNDLAGAEFAKEWDRKNFPPIFCQSILYTTN